MAARLLEDEHLGPDGRVMEVLSEHTCQGWLEGYLLTGRHGVFSTAMLVYRPRGLDAPLSM